MALGRMNMGYTEFYDMLPTVFKNKYLGYIAKQKEDLLNRRIIAAQQTLVLANSLGTLKRPLTMSQLLPDVFKPKKLTKEERQRHIDIANSIKWNK